MPDKDKPVNWMALEKLHDLAKYSPDQPRDDHGRFGEGGGGGTQSPGDATRTIVGAYDPTKENLSDAMPRSWAHAADHARARFEAADTPRAARDAYRETIKASLHSAGYNVSVQHVSTGVGSGSGWVALSARSDSALERGVEHLQEAGFTVQQEGTHPTIAYPDSGN